MTDTTAGEGVVVYGDERDELLAALREKCPNLYALPECPPDDLLKAGEDSRADEAIQRELDRVKALAAQPSAGAQGEALWAMHIRGPDDLYPAPDYDTAVKWCDYVNYSAAPRSPDVITAAVPTIWPYAPERHQDGLAESVAGWTLPLNADGTEQVIKPLYATPAQPDTGDVAALREARTYALEMTKKHGNPDGTDYEQGQNDMGFRWVSQLDTMIAALSKPNAPGREG